MKGQSIIIKKVKKAGHGGAHGGSWKVAYADFVTAMMAFFLLMWLITMVSPEKKLALSNYFQSVTIFDSMGMSFLGKGAEVLDTGIKNSQQLEGETKGGNISTSLADKLQGNSKEKLKEKIKKEVEAKLTGVKDQVLVEVIEGGIRIQMLDKDLKPMFPLGGSELTPDARKILQIVSDNIKTLKSARISIEGHTDALNYSTNKYTNWELSTDRASAARRELEHNGLNPDNIAKVAGLAATEPLIKADPTDPRNRRISIVVLTDTSASAGDNVQSAVPTPQAAEQKGEAIKPGIVRINPLAQ
ncbi:MAG: OmpA family protein [Nitrospirae bacterium]|nr:OmpA family protein [Nitrospirota bacterium]